MKMTKNNNDFLRPDFQLICKHDFEPNTTMNFMQCEHCGIRQATHNRIKHLEERPVIHQKEIDWKKELKDKKIHL
jgi:hypothetical protein